MANIDEKYMRECIKLAKKGLGKTSPNPLVGCVVLNSSGTVVSKGYHKKYGKNHAERDALLKLKNNEARGGTLYVNLEPCSHYGKTPPCTDIILESGIKKVVFGMEDINPKVNGASLLRKAGVEVVSGVLKDECEFLNRIFIKNIQTEMPYVVYKTATTLDGKISTSNGSSKWITSSDARDEVYRMRKLFDCIMTSSNTVLADNPKMEHKHKCILDRNLRIPSNYNIFAQGKIFMYSSENTPVKDNKLDLKYILKDLYKRGICSIFLECGGVLAGEMLRESLIDEIYHFISPKILNDNSGKSCFDGDKILDISGAKVFKIYETKSIDTDVLIKLVKQS